MCTQKQSFALLGRDSCACTRCLIKGVLASASKASRSDRKQGFRRDVGHRHSVTVDPGERTEQLASRNLWSTAVADRHFPRIIMSAEDWSLHCELVMGVALSVCEAGNHATEANTPHDASAQQSQF